jgi:hypothetical protein
VVPVVDVGIVGVAMEQLFVPVPVRVRLAAVPREIVLVTVMRVVAMRVLVLERLVDVLVLVALGDAAPRVQHPGEQHRVHLDDERLRGRRARAEEQRRRQRGEDRVHVG